MYVSNYVYLCAEFKKKLLDATLLEKWNSKIRKPEVIAVLAFAENQTSVLEWYRIRSNRTAVGSHVFYQYNYLSKQILFAGDFLEMEFTQESNACQVLQTRWSR